MRVSLHKQIVQASEHRRCRTDNRRHEYINLFSDLCDEQSRGTMRELDNATTVSTESW